MKGTAWGGLAWREEALAADHSILRVPEERGQQWWAGGPNKEASAMPLRQLQVGGQTGLELTTGRGPAGCTLPHWYPSILIDATQ